MEMIIVVLAGTNQRSVGTAVTSEVCPTVTHQSWGGGAGRGLGQEAVRFSFAEKIVGCQSFSSSPRINSSISCRVAS